MSIDLSERAYAMDTADKLLVRYLLLYVQHS